MWGEPLRLWTSQPSLGTMENDRWAIDDHSPPQWRVEWFNGGAPLGSSLPWAVHGPLGGAAMWGEPLRLLTSQPSLGTLENDRWAIDDHSPPANINGGSVGPWHVRGGLPCEESHSGSRHRSLPWGLWRLTDGPLMITVFLRISMECPLGCSYSGGGCHVRRATPALDIAAFPGDSGDWPMGHWWSQSPCEYQWRVGWFLARQGGAAM